MLSRPRLLSLSLSLCFWISRRVANRYFHSLARRSVRGCTRAFAGDESRGLRRSRAGCRGSHRRRDRSRRELVQARFESPRITSRSINSFPVWPRRGIFYYPRLVRRLMENDRRSATLRSKGALLSIQGAVSIPGFGTIIFNYHTFYVHARAARPFHRSKRRTRVSVFLIRVLFSEPDSSLLRARERALLPSKTPPPHLRDERSSCVLSLEDFRISAL